MMEGDGMGGLGSEIMKLGVRDKKSITFSGQVVDIQAERNRQNELRDSGKFNHTCADPGVGSDLKNNVLLDMLANCSILAEEFGEYANEQNELVHFDHWIQRNVVRSGCYENGTALEFRQPPKAKWGYNVKVAEADIDSWIERVRQGYLARMREELVQVAAVALGMIERLDLEG